MRKDKNKAIELRKTGHSYNEISKFLNIPKSTLSLWLKDLKMSQEIKGNNIFASKRIWARNITQYNKLRAQKAREAAVEIQLNATREFSQLNKNDLKLVGTALYWAEGYNRAKYNALFCNSDPRMVKLMMRFFREICNVPEEKFRPQVQIHKNISALEAENYWSSIIGLDKKMFSKPISQIPKSSTNKRPHNILPYGTFRVRIADAKVLYRIKGLIAGLAQKTQLDLINPLL